MPSIKEEHSLQRRHESCQQSPREARERLRNHIALVGDRCDLCTDSFKVRCDLPHVCCDPSHVRCELSGPSWGSDSVRGLQAVLQLDASVLTKKDGSTVERSTVVINTELSKEFSTECEGQAAVH